ncbi:hypothetical protein SARC_07117 [Sphaeroforma arctica JP610]|uniref:Uncharacterized protein n=1 Tax=Sphaeroforma arctica JP610 TaxID=667725 RepID=A0A0L0FV61_9EUKA|nr:hypothetical protein SARC_07117 [Sphaeroforma arctica JP610]KNC80524.1 hypothetical protein SARC_07117 [Sphaeroforma arctica JP610]|eukprot:XP_014154426.1 hypothetical protein SARC_07117 [Sphaeroforma arctica JP610]
MQNCILKLDADLKHPDIKKDDIPQWYEFLAMHMFCKNIGNYDRESLNTELRRKYANEPLDLGHRVKVSFESTTLGSVLSDCVHCIPSRTCDLSGDGDCDTKKPREQIDQGYVSW